MRRIQCIVLVALCFLLLLGMLQRRHQKSLLWCSKHTSSQRLAVPATKTMRSAVSFDDDDEAAMHARIGRQLDTQRHMNIARCTMISCPKTTTPHHSFTWSSFATHFSNQIPIAFQWFHLLPLSLNRIALPIQVVSSRRATGRSTPLGIALPKKFLVAKLCILFFVF